MKCNSLVLLFCLLMLSAGCVSAGFTMSLRTVSEMVSDTQARINFTLTNTGDETAFQIILEPILPAGFNSKNLYSSGLPPNKPLTGAFDITINENVTEGRYPVVLKLHYSDRNSYPFSIIFPEAIRFKEGKTAKVQLTIPTTQITGPEPVDFKLKVFNQDTKAHNVSIVLYTSNELDADINTTEIEIGPQASVSMENKIWSKGALYDSNYLILASLSYLEDGKVYSTMAQGRASIVKPSALKIGSNLFKESQWILVIFVLIAIVLVVFLALRERKTVKDEKKAVKKKAGKKKA